MLTGSVVILARHAQAVTFRYRIKQLGTPVIRDCDITHTRTVKRRHRLIITNIGNPRRSIVTGPEVQERVTPVKQSGRQQRRVGKRHLRSHIARLQTSLPRTESREQQQYGNPHYDNRKNFLHIEVFRFTLKFGIMASRLNTESPPIFGSRDCVVSRSIRLSQSLCAAKLIPYPPKNKFSD